jgi:hypothetical protein
MSGAERGPRGGRVMRPMGSDDDEREGDMPRGIYERNDEARQAATEKIARFLASEGGADTNDADAIAQACGIENGVLARKVLCELVEEGAADRLRGPGRSWLYRRKGACLSATEPIASTAKPREMLRTPARPGGDLKVSFDLRSGRGALHAHAGELELELDEVQAIVGLTGQERGLE